MKVMVKVRNKRGVAINVIPMFCILSLVRARTSVHDSSIFLGGESSSPPCSCECCESERSETDSEEIVCTLMDEVYHLDKSMFRKSVRSCPQRCMKQLSDVRMDYSLGNEVDFSQFCFSECEPDSISLKHSFVRGGRCKALAPFSTKNPHAHDQTAENALRMHMNQVVKMKGKKYFHLVKNRVASDEPEWMKHIHELSIKAGEAAVKAENKLDEIRAKEVAADTTTKKNQTTLPNVIGEAGNISDVASRVQKSARQAADLSADIEIATHEAAFDTIEDELSSLKEDEIARAKIDAQKIADKIKKEMLARAPKEAKKAAVPYTDALNRAAAMATEYSKRGDNLGGQSANLQMQANMLLGQAQQWQNAGQIPKAQKVMQQAHQLMNLAIALAAQSDSNYGTAKSIMGTLGAYIGEAAQASYHAEVMWNPDAPPPPDPLV